MGGGMDGWKDAWMEGLGFQLHPIKIQCLAIWHLHSSLATIG